MSWSWSCFPSSAPYPALPAFLPVPGTGQETLGLPLQPHLCAYPRLRLQVQWAGPQFGSFTLYLNVLSIVTESSPRATDIAHGQT